MRSAEPDSDRMWSLTSWSLKWGGLDLLTTPDWLQRPTRQTRSALKRRGFLDVKAIFVRRGGP